MAFKNMVVASAFDNVSHLGLDILIFVTTEFLMRLVFAKNTGRAGHMKLLLTQGTLLMILSLLLALFHHVPYILGIAAVSIVIRLAVFMSERRNGADNGVVSRPLRYTPENEDVVPTPQTVQEPNILPRNQLLGFSSGQNAPSAHNLYNRHAQPQVLQGNNVAESTLWSQSSLPPKYTHHWQRDYTSTPYSTLRNRTVAPIKQGVSTAGSLLQRPSTSPGTVHTKLGDTHTVGQSDPLSIYCQHLSLGYLSSVFNPRKPSETPPGILNAGNTCFMNSILQCLTWTAGFSETVPRVFSGSDEQSSFIKNLHAVLNQTHAVPDGVSIFSSIDASGLIISTSQLAPHLTVAPGSGKSQSQQDAAEYLLWLLDSLHNLLRQQGEGVSVPRLPADSGELLSRRQACLRELERANSDDVLSFQVPLTALSEIDWQLHWQSNSSSLYDMFLGQLMEVRECQKCKRMSVNVEYFTLLPLPVPSMEIIGHEFKLQDCFQLFSEVEELVKSNMLQCSCTSPNPGGSASLTPGRRLAMLSRPPKLLIIQLTRFSYDSVHNAPLKNLTPVAVPLVFDLFQYTAADKLKCKLYKSTTYHLYAFCSHTGGQSTSHGHYVAHCKAADGLWYCFNDRRVTCLRDIHAEVSSNFVLCNAYLLFYALEDC